MKQSFEELTKMMEVLQFVFEEVINDHLDDNKLKKKAIVAWKKFSSAVDSHQNMISDEVPKVKFQTPSEGKEFQEIWKEYNDYMIEQHSTRMGSRMQKNRLRLLMKLVNNDVSLLIKFLKYFMANGSASIYFVNQKNLINNEPKAANNKSGIKIHP